MKTFYNSFLLLIMVCGGVNTLAQDSLQSEFPIAEFTSVKPTGQTETIIIPETHTFQVIAKSGSTAYTSGEGTLASNLDFTAYIPVEGSSTEGYLSVNHETSPGGVSLINLKLNEGTMLWEVGEVRKVDFDSVGGTLRNCSGGITSWGTVITSEESVNSGDANEDGYQDFGWQVEIDPVTGQIIDYDNDGRPDKLWKHGRIKHENLAISEDGSFTYQADDGASGCIFKFVPTTPKNLSAGKLYVLKKTDNTRGKWVEVPNDQESLNNLSTIASSLGGTNWHNPEDVEIGPDGKVYFTSKGSGTIWRFKDKGPFVSEIEAWVRNQQYKVEFEGGVQMEDWGTGIDNLAFDPNGNLWALQDGGRDNVWVIFPDHTPENPRLKLFMTTPSGSEPTGLTFSPDGRFGFISMQHPASGNSTIIKDATGNDVQFNKDITLVFARKENLSNSGIPTGSPYKADAARLIEVYPNPFISSTTIKVNIARAVEVSIDVYDLTGKKVNTIYNGNLASGEHFFDFSPAVENKAGNYMVRLFINNERATSIMVRQK